jgi:hypothetical protein
MRLGVETGGGSLAPSPVPCMRGVGSGTKCLMKMYHHIRYHMLMFESFPTGESPGQIENMLSLR